MTDVRAEMVGMPSPRKMAMIRRLRKKALKRLRVEASGRQDLRDVVSLVDELEQAWELITRVSQEAARIQEEERPREGPLGPEESRGTEELEKGASPKPPES